MTKKAITELVDQIIQSKKNAFTEANRELLETLPQEALENMLPKGKGQQYTRLDSMLDAAMTKPKDNTELVETAVKLYSEKNPDSKGNANEAKMMFYTIKRVLVKAQDWQDAAEILIKL